MRAGSLRSGLLVLTTTAMGAGVLTLPFAVKELGWVLGSAIVLALGVLNVASLELLLDAGIKHGASSYSELVALVRGPWTASALDATVSVITWGAVIAYFIFLKQLLPGLLVVTFGVPAWLARAEIILPTVAALVFMIALPRDITAIGKFSMAGVVSVVYIVVLLVCSAFSRGHGLLSLPACSLDGSMSLQEVTNASALIIAGFLCQYNVFFIYSDVKEPTMRRLRKITRISTFFQALCYLTLGLCGYASFGEETHDNIYTNFASGDAWASVGRLLVCASLCVSIPLCVFAARSNLVSLISRCLPAGDGTGVDARFASPRLQEMYARSVEAAEEQGVHVDHPIFSRSRAHSHASDAGSKLSSPLLEAREGRNPLTGGAIQAMPTDELPASGWVLHVAATACIITVTTALSFVIPSVSFLLGKLGGICGVTQMYIMPGLVLLGSKDLRPPAQKAATLVGFFMASTVGLAAVIL